MEAERSRTELFELVELRIRGDLKARHWLQAAYEYSIRGSLSGRLTGGELVLINSNWREIQRAQIEYQKRVKQIIEEHGLSFSAFPIIEL